MGGLSSPLEFQTIAATIRAARGGIATAGTIALRLRRGEGLVQRALDEMVRLGLVDRYQAVGRVQYMIRKEVSEAIGAAAPMAPGPRAGAAADDDDGADADELSIFGMSEEAQQAAVIWCARMGTDRWHDDPRALREQMHKPHLMPPFLTHMAREV